MSPLKLAAGWVALQLLFFIGWAAREQARAGSGDSILVTVVPVDPRDLLRGQYLTLGYRFSRPWDSAVARIRVPDQELVWVVLRAEGPFHVPARLSLERPVDLAAGEVALRGSARAGRYVFGVERYFVPEGSETPAPSDLTVRLRVGPDGAARIEQVYVKGERWP